MNRYAKQLAEIEKQVAALGELQALVPEQSDALRAAIVALRDRASKLRSLDSWFSDVH